MPQPHANLVPLTPKSLFQRSPHRTGKNRTSSFSSTSSMSVDVESAARSPVCSSPSFSSSPFKLNPKYLRMTWAEATASVFVVVTLIVILLVVLFRRPPLESPESVRLEALLNRVFTAAGKGPVSQDVRDAIAAELAKETAFEIRRVVHLRGTPGEG